MYSFVRGIKNILRKKNRTVVMVLVLSIGVGIFLTMAQAYSTVSEAIGELQTKFQNQIVIRAAGSTEMGLGVELLPDTLINEIEKIPGIAQVENILYRRIISEEKDPAISVTVGINPGEEIRLASHGSVGSPTLILGRDPEPSDEGKNAAYVGQVYAEKWLGLDVEKLLQERPKNLGTFKINNEEFEIVGIFSSGFTFGDNQVVIPYKTVQKMYPDLAGKVTNIYVIAQNVGEVPNIVKELKKEFGARVDVIAGLSRVELIIKALGRIARSSLLGAMLATAVASIMIIAFMMLIVFERRKEIGTLKALGASQQNIISQFFAESLTLSIASGIVGILVFSFVGPQLASRILGIVTGEPLAQHIETPISGVTLSFQPNFFVLVLVASLILLLGIIGSLYPAWKIAKVSPAEALKSR